VSREVVQQRRCRRDVRRGRVDQASLRARRVRAKAVRPSIRVYALNCPAKLVGTTPRIAVCEICVPFMNQIAVAPVLVSRQRISLFPSPSKSSVSPIDQPPRHRQYKCVRAVVPWPRLSGESDASGVARADVQPDVLLGLACDDPDAVVLDFCHLCVLKTLFVLTL
jgi:hypothetical protein